MGGKLNIIPLREDGNIQKVYNEDDDGGGEEYDDEVVVFQTNFSSILYIICNIFGMGMGYMKMSRKEPSCGYMHYICINLKIKYRVMYNEAFNEMI